MTKPNFAPPAPPNRPELFFALISATGTKLNEVTQALRAELTKVGYKLADEAIVRLSEQIAALPGYENLREFDGPEDERIEAYMDAGDNVRRKYGEASFVAALAVSKIRELRQAPQPEQAYLFRSLKHPKEVELLRAIYGASLVVIGVYDTHARRIEQLTARIEKSRADLGRAKEGARVRAEFLIKRDQEGQLEDGGRSTHDCGQNVSKAFPLADFFLDLGSDCQPQIKRLIELVFQHPYMSPSREEYAMFMAQAVALRSADMSRQVGAAIVDQDGEILAAGCNEVPKPGGGVYWTGDASDHRDFRKGEDPNARLSHEVLEQVFEALGGRGWLSAEQADRSPAALAEAARAAKVFEGARITNLIEFGRVVHAEMNALTYAARRGVAIDGKRLFCTTFPCHICARHIIGAGIAEVVYIEPYPKSLTRDLYPDAVQLDPPPGTKEHEKVTFRAFMGVAPRRYMDFFRHGRRKTERGYALEWEPGSAQPTVRSLGNPHLVAEAELCYKLNSALRSEDEDQPDA